MTDIASSSDRGRCQSDVRLLGFPPGSDFPFVLFFAFLDSIRQDEREGVGLVNNGQTAAIARARRVTTGPLPRVPVAAMRRAQTLESRMPMLFGAAFVGLIAIQAWLALG